MTIRWLSDDYPMTIWWLSDDYPMTIRWLSDDYPTTIRWLSEDYLMTIRWLSRTFDKFFLMIIDLKRSLDRRWLFKSGATFILRWSCFFCCLYLQMDFTGSAVHQKGQIRLNREISLRQVLLEASNWKGCFLIKPFLVDDLESAFSSHQFDILPHGTSIVPHR